MRAFTTAGTLPNESMEAEGCQRRRGVAAPPDTLFKPGSAMLPDLSHEMAMHGHCFGPVDVWNCVDLLVSLLLELHRRRQHSAEAGMEGNGVLVGGR